MVFVSTVVLITSTEAYHLLKQCLMHHSSWLWILVIWVKVSSYSCTRLVRTSCLFLFDYLYTYIYGRILILVSVISIAMSCLFIFIWEEKKPASNAMWFYVSCTTTNMCSAWGEKNSIDAFLPKLLTQYRAYNLFCINRLLVKKFIFGQLLIK